MSEQLSAGKICPKGQTFDRETKRCRAKKSPGRKLEHRKSKIELKAGSKVSLDAFRNGYTKIVDELKLMEKTVEEHVFNSAVEKLVKEMQAIRKREEELKDQKINMLIEEMSAQEPKRTHAPAQESNDLKRLKEALEKFQSVQDKWDSVGANDSESNLALKLIMKGEETPSDDIYFWGLFEDKEGVYEAAEELNEAAINLKKIADKSTSEDVKQFLVKTDYLRNFPL